MAFELIILREAEQELDDAAVWYETQRPGLGDHFLRVLGDTFARITERPLDYACILRHYRRAVTRTFSYCVIFAFDGESVTVHAVTHTSRAPQIWQERLP